MLPEGTTMADVAEWLRKQYPGAVSASLFVNYYDHEVTVRDRSPSRVRSEFKAASVRRLDGEWAR